MTPFANLLLLISFSSAAIATSSDNTKQNDTSTEAVLDEAGNVDLVDPRVTIIGSKIKEAVRDGSFGDGHPFNVDEDEDGFKFINGGDLRFTSKGMVNSIEPMPDGVPKGFPKIRKAVMTVQYGGKTKEAKLKDLYDDIAANEKEWLTFLDHPINIEFVFECLAVCHEYAVIQHDTYKDRDACLKALDIEQKLLDILQKQSAHFDEDQKGAFGNVEYKYDDFVFRNGLVVTISREGSEVLRNIKLLKKLVRFEKKNNVPADYEGYMHLWKGYREEMKERGMEVPHDIEKVDDKVIAEHIRARRLMGKKRDDRKLKKGLIDFFELDGTIVSSQKKKRIKDFVEGLSDEKAIELVTLWVSGMGGLSIEQKMGIRKEVGDDIDGYLRALGQMP